MFNMPRGIRPRLSKLKERQTASRGSRTKYAAPLGICIRMEKRCYHRYMLDGVPSVNRETDTQPVLHRGQGK